MEFTWEFSSLANQLDDESLSILASSIFEMNAIQVCLGYANVYTLSTRSRNLFFKNSPLGAKFALSCIEQNPSFKN